MSLAIAQHYGLPTRLLDWTHSPLVAAHFATAETGKYEVDGIIWCVDVEGYVKKLWKGVQDMVDEFPISIFTIEMLSREIPNLARFRAMSTEKPMALFYEIPCIDERIEAQHCLFSVMADPTASLEDWLNEDPDCYRKIIVPKEVKWEIRDKLDHSNINERTLFPGKDGLCDWLARKYSLIPELTRRVAKSKS